MPYSEANSRLLLIDDRDPAVTYEGLWTRESYFGLDMSAALAPNASVSMDFDGTRIILVALAVPVDWGYISPPTVQFAIDGVIMETVTPAPVSDWTFAPIFDKQGLADGTHTVNATVLATTDTYPLLLDYFMFQPSKKYWDLASAPKTLEVTGGPGGDDGSGSGVARAPSRRPPAGAIAGGVLGGLALLALGVAAFFWWRRRKQHAYSALGEPDEPKSERTVTPFLSTRPSSFSSDPKRVSIEPSDTLLPSASTPAPAPALALGFGTTFAPTTQDPPPSPYSSTGATVAPSTTPLVATAGATGYAVHEAPHLHSMHGRVGRADAEPPRPHKTMADLVHATLQAARRNAARREAATATETPPPQYSER